MKWIKTKEPQRELMPSYLQNTPFTQYNSDKGEFKAIFFKIASCTYFLLFNALNQEITPNFNGGIRFGQRETLNRATKLLNQFDFNDSEIGNNKNAFNKLNNFCKEISK